MGGRESVRWRERYRVGEDWSFLLEMLKIASGNQIRAISILSSDGTDRRETGNSKTEWRKLTTDSNFQ